MTKTAAQTKPVVVFVGSFAPAANGVVGGQLYACRTLLDSPLSQHVEWRLVDSTTKTQQLDNVVRRTWYAFRRILTVLRLLLFGRVTGLLIFAPFLRSSLLEKGTMCVLGRLFRKRTVLTLRSEIFDKQYTWLFRAGMRLVARSCTVIICQSDSAAERLQRLFGISPDKLRVIPNWIDAGKYRRRSPRQAWTAEGRPPRVVYIGWLEPYKGVNELVAAFTQLAAEGVPFTAKLCGAGSLLAGVREQLAAAGLADRVDAAGWVTGEPLIEALWHADIFTLPSYSEGLPNALLEAMAAELPAVATPVGGIPGTIQDGVNGLLVPVADAAALSEALRKLLTDPALALEMGRRSAERIATEHDLNTVWCKVAAELLGERAMHFIP